MRTSMLIAAVGLTAVVGLAGCGSSKSSEGAPSTTAVTATTTGDATVASFTEQANALCTTFEKQIDAMIVGAGDGSSAAETNAAEAEFLTKASGLVDQLVAQMQALPQPESLSTQLQAIYAQAAQVQSINAQSITALEQGQTAQLNTLSEQDSTASDSFDQQLEAIGITACGSGSSSGSTTTTTTAG